MEPIFNDSPGSGRRTRCGWWLGAAVLALVMLARAATWLVWLGQGLPATPLDRTQSELARQWQTLAEAAALVPSGAVVTVREAGAGDEMSLHMMAVGLIPSASVVPSSYYGRPTPELAARATLVLVSGGDCSLEPGLEPLARLQHGWLCRRARK